MQSDSTPDIPYGFCQCGCGQRTRIAPKNDASKEWIKGVPLRYLKGHVACKTPHTMEEFRVEDRGYLTPCWTWQRLTTGGGYGQISIKGKMRQAHIVYFERVNGPVPDGLDLDHLCRNRDCVNPDHVEPVTPRINTLRGISPSAVNAVKTHCKHGHEFTPENTIIRPKGGRACRECNRIKLRESRRRKAGR